MPYSWEQMSRFAIEKPTAEEQAIPDEEGVSHLDTFCGSLLKVLSTVGGGKKCGRSRVDDGAMRLLLEAGLSPADARATFRASARGKDALARKNGHGDDYINRTLRHAMSVTKKGNSVKKAKDDAIELDDGSDWRKEFKSRNELDDGVIEHVVDTLSPEEGITGLGALPATLKTFIMLSWAKAISSGALLWGQFKTRKLRVLYLIPESGDKSFRRRMVKMRIPNTEKFLVRTMSMGKMLSLEDARLRAAVKGRVIFLDTLVRFTERRDEQ